MKSIALFLIPLLLAATVHAADAPELEKLRASYKAAVGKATKLILQAHIVTLEKLRDTYTRAANLVAATKVQADIDRTNVAMSMGEYNPPATDANNVTAPELDKARAAHDADIERAIKSYRETYVRELEKLRDNYTRATNLAGATAAQAELDALKPGGAPAGKAAELQASGQQPRLSGKAPKSEWYIGKTWVNSSGTAWTFAKGGGGEVKYDGGKTVPMTWDITSKGVLKTRQESSRGTGISTMYLYIMSPVEGMSGLGEDELRKPLQLKQ